MLLGRPYQLICFLTDLVLVRTRSDARLPAQVLALRHQLRVLARKAGKPAWQPGDRLVLAAISQFLPRPFQLGFGSPNGGRQTMQGVVAVSGAPVYAGHGRA